MSEGWEATTLGEVAEFTNGFPFKPHQLAGSTLPVIRIKQLLNASAEVDLTDVDVPSRNRIEDGDLIFSWSGTLASRFWDRGPAALNQHLFRVAAKTGSDLGWIHLVLDHAVEELGAKTHGTTMKHITKGVLESHAVERPPLPVQRRIVDVMTHVDSHLANLRAERASLVPVLALLRKELLESGNFLPLANFAAPNGIQIGPFGSQLHAHEYTTEGIPVVMPRDISAGGIQDAKIKRVPLDVAARLSRHRLMPGDIVFPRRGDLSKRALVTAQEEGWLCGTGCIRFRPSIDTEAGQVFQSISGESATSWLIEHAVGTTMLNLNSQIVGSLPVVVPSAQAAPVSEAAKTLSILLVNLDEEMKEIGRMRLALLSTLLDASFLLTDSYDLLLPEVA